MRGPTGLKLPLDHTRIRDLILKWVKTHKKAALLLGSLPVTVPLFYFADVWTIGSLAAVIHDFQVKLSAISILASQEQKMAAETHATMLPYISKHPISTGMAWLTKPTEALSHPEVKNIWKWLNVLLGAALAIGYPAWRLRHRGGNSSTRIHGLKIVDNPAYGTSRWASINDLKQFCEYGPPYEMKKKGY